MLAAGGKLGPLPNARLEARRLARDVGRGSRLLVGNAASEHFVKTADLTRFGILHLAAHAIVDDRQPHRSGVVLAPGAPDENGFLQMREVVTLELDGSLVVLSACSGASGELTEGEGVLGLDRAFFQAGARAVVASHWPLRDDEAADFMSDLGEHLSRGETVGSALTAARRERILAGTPTAAWAGMIVLGDPDLAPVQGWRPGWLRRPGRTAAVALLVFVLLVSLLYPRRGLP